MNAPWFKFGFNSFVIFSVVLPTAVKVRSEVVATAKELMPSVNSIVLLAAIGDCSEHEKVVISFVTYSHNYIS